MCDLAFLLDDRRNIGTIVEKRYVSLLISPSIALPRSTQAVEHEESRSRIYSALVSDDSELERERYK